MFAALRGHYVQFVEFMGVAEPYPEWFIEEVANRAFINESRYCFWVSPSERQPDYYEKELIEDFSVVIRKSNGETHVMDYDTFKNLYMVFKYDRSENGGIAAFVEDVIEYVECSGGVLIDDYPEWVYEHFTECLNNPKDEESFLVSVDGRSYISIKEHCAILRNHLGEIRQVTYGNFLKYYDPRNDDVLYYDHRTLDEYWWEGCPF